MASAARAYQSYGYESVYAPARSRVHVTPGKRQGRQQESVSFVVVAVAVAAFFVVAALFAAAHVWLDSASVSLSMQSQTVHTELSAIRHEGSLLEVEVSALSNPTRIQEAANAMGMISPANATIVKLGEDVVVTNAAGNLSLAGSAKVIANAS